MNTKPTVVDTDSFGVVWTDERLKAPEHYTAQIDSFQVSVRAPQAPEILPNGNEPWVWGVECAYFVAKGTAKTRDDARELARAAIRLLKLSTVEELKGWLRS